MVIFNNVIVLMKSFKCSFIQFLFNLKKKNYLGGDCTVAERKHMQIEKAPKN